jgi:metal-responsive CopG/Arc/MetJ family transcriptional regulator
MEKEHIAVYLPTPLVARVDGVASSEMRSRANTVRWLVKQALQRRESVDAERAAAG